VRALLARGHTAYLVHAGAGSGELPVHDVPLSSDLLPVHEYLPAQPGRQQAVSAMDCATAGKVIEDFESALVLLDPSPDLIICHHANVAAVASQGAAQRWRIPYVLFVHGTGIEPRHHGGYDDSIWAQIEESMESATAIIVTTSYVRDELVRPIVNLPVERFQIIPCGVDLEAYRPGEGEGARRRFGLPEIYVISPGAVTELKGPQNVAAASVEYSDLAPTIFIGDGDLRQRLEAELGDRGRFLGYVSEADKVALINAATVLAAAPEKMEHFGIVYAEALAAGTVPVAYRGGGVADIIAPSAGELIDRNPAALGRAVRRLLEDPERRAAMAEAGRLRAGECFDKRALGDRLVDWVENIA